MLDKIKDNIPLITVFLLIICLVRLTVFYWTFGIAIGEYIEFGEIITLLSDYLLTSVGGLILYILTCFAGMHAIEVLEARKAAKIADVNLQLPGIESTTQPGFETWHYVMMSIGVYVVVLVFFRYKILGFIAGLIFIIAIWVVIFGFREGFKLLKNDNDSEDARKYNDDLQKIRFVLSASLVFVLFNFVYACGQAYALKNVDIKQRVAIEYEGKLLRTSPTYVYLGRVKNFTFFYNKQTKRAHIYPNSGIKRTYFKDY